MKKRENNLELLRIISMLMVITLHLLNFGGFLYRYDNNFISFIVWLMESICFIAVNCYVLISGYFLVNSKFTISKLIKTIIEVVFYSVLIYIIMVFLGEETFTIKHLIKSFLPIFFGKYWFATCYVELYLLSPFINVLIHNLSKKQYKNLLIILFITFSCWSCIISNTNTINYGGSYSISWFILIYLFAGYIRLHVNLKDIKGYKYFLGYVFCSFINVFFYIINSSKIYVKPDFLYNYYSITILVGSICLFVSLLKLSIKNKVLNKLISFFAPTTFGIYLIHENSSMRGIIWGLFNYSEYTNLSNQLGGGRNDDVIYYYNSNHYFYSF